MKKFAKWLCATVAVMLAACVFVACGGGADNGEIDNGDNKPDIPPDVVTKYTVTWIAENGETLLSEKVEKGAVPSYTYTKQDTAEWHYTVKGWSASLGGEVLQALPAVTADASYYAVVEKAKRKYTVTFDGNGGSDIASVTDYYGELINAPTEKPNFDGKRFVGWTTDKAGNNRAVFPITLTGNITLYAAWNDFVDVKALLGKLVGGYKCDPYSYIPDAMLPVNAAGAVNPDTVKKTEADYADFVNTAQMPHNGFGEQWHMVTDNLAQSQLFFNALSVVDTIGAATVAVFNNHVDSNPEDSAHYAFKHGIYNVTVDCGIDKIYYVLDYTAKFPIIGEQRVQIAMSMRLDESAKTVRIQLGDANALTYTLKPNGYEFAIKYTGVRRAMFQIERNADGTVTGHINEFLTVSGVTDKAVASAADFYIDGNYVSAVGNKASGMLAFKGYISELYDCRNGKMLGYEVRETQELAGKSVTFNTLWFDLADVSGITSVKCDSESNKFYVNGSAEEFKAKKVGGISLKTASRRYDIEFRTQYFYAIENDEIVEVEVKTPMLFVQEEQYDTLTKDIAGENAGLDVSVTLADAHLNKIKTDYATLVDEFIKNKDNVTVDSIIAFIGEAVKFD